MMVEWDRKISSPTKCGYSGIMGWSRGDDLSNIGNLGLQTCARARI
jgi:hypothetical protein